MFPIVITGPRLTLREFRSNDLDASMAVVGDPDVTRTLSFDPRSRTDQAQRLQQDITRAQTQPRPDYYLAIANSTDLLVGFVRIGLGRDQSGELGYAVRRDDWGKGYATEAAALMLNFGFEKLRLHRIQAACGPDNHASQRLLARLTFTPEGRIRDHVFTDGAWRDSLLYSILDHEWADQRPPTGRVR
ncbi:GNAT family N-acetyltransferase [Micromonospora musae]|uniref:GNAT family N-acetyltransferase n=1 Tax=Micromonospora musae TaxID=1894970 RepID=UPI00343C7551